MLHLADYSINIYTIFYLINPIHLSRRNRKNSEKVLLEVANYANAYVSISPYPYKILLVFGHLLDKNKCPFLISPILCWKKHVVTA